MEGFPARQVQCFRTLLRLYVRMIHNYGMDEQSSFALSGLPAPFNLLALVLDVEL